MNRVHLIGNLTRDVELKHGQSGVAYCHIGIAVNERVKNKAGEWEDRTTFVDCSAFAWTAEKLGTLRKGNAVDIIGKLHLDTWVDNNSGQRRSKLQVIVEEVYKLEYIRTQPREQQPQPQAPREQPNTTAPEANDIPF